MKKSLKIFFSLIIVFAMVIIVKPVQANYQANNGTKATVYNMSDAMAPIRAMEGNGQVMGLTETYNGTTLKATSASNNIDVHQIKGTEWGAIALLSASQDYGKKGSGTNRYVVGGTNLQTTTGNVYGMYLTSDKGTYIAEGNKGYYVTDSWDNRYINWGINTHVGSAFLNWHNKAYSNYDPYPITRGRNGIFSYERSINTNKYIRACVVCGQGF